MADISPLVMGTNNEQVYVLYVGSFDVTAEILQGNETRELYVEIAQDGMAVQATEAVKRSKSMSWNEKFLVMGNSSSTISLVI